MSSSSTSLPRRLFRSRGGAAALEFALFVPTFLILLVGVVEYGRLLSQTNTIEKGLRAGALVAARTPGCCPLSAAQRTVIENVVKTGSVNGSQPFLVDGWQTGTVTITTDQSITVDSNVLPIIRLEARVPFQTIVPDLLTLLGLNIVEIRTSHEQVYLLGG